MTADHITQPYTLAELRAKIASHDYSAELLLQHAMLLLDRQAPAEGDAVRAERDQLLEQLAAAQREVIELRTDLKCAHARIAAERGGASDVQPKGAAPDVPEGYKLVLVPDESPEGEPDWEEVRRQAEVVTGIKVERNTFSIVIREVRRWLAHRATTPTVIYSPIQVNSHAVEMGREHPNNCETPDEDRFKYLDLRGDDKGQGLSVYWKWGHAAGWNDHKKHVAATQAPAPAQGSWVSAEDVQRLARELDIAINGEAGAALAPQLYNVVAQAVGIMEARRAEFPVVARWTGGAKDAGPRARVWVQFEDDGPEVEFAPAALQGPAVKAEPLSNDALAAKAQLHCALTTKSDFRSFCEGARYAERVHSIGVSPPPPARDCPHCNFSGAVHCGDVADKIRARGGEPGDCSNAKVYGLRGGGKP